MKTMKWTGLALWFFAATGCWDLPPLKDKGMCVYECMLEGTCNDKGGHVTREQLCELGGQVCCQLVTGDTSAGDADGDIDTDTDADADTDTDADADTDTDADADTDTDADTDADADTDTDADADTDADTDSLTCGETGVEGDPCGEQECPASACDGATKWNIYPATCTRRCDGLGECEPCACKATPVACSVASGNACCAAACSDATGCYTVPGSCGGGDSCGDPHTLEVSQVCQGCGAAGAKGTCGVGATFTCSAASHVSCQAVSCGGESYYCTNAGGAWQWRKSSTCDDGSLCTYGDQCGSEGCKGTAIECASDDCTARSCNGTSACKEVYEPSTETCGSTACPSDSCSDGKYLDYPSSCTRTCNGGGGCGTCTCTASQTVCAVGAGNECCTATCTAGAGCATVAGSCADSCGATTLSVSRTCGGCGANGAKGTCTGTAYTCEASHASEQRACGGTTYTCTNALGSWQWKTGTFYQQCGADGDVHLFSSSGVEGAEVTDCTGCETCTNTSSTTAVCQAGGWFDSTAKLCWEDPPSETYRTWEGAKSYCADLDWGGHMDWELPTISELRSLMRGPDGGCYWDPALSGECWQYWSSSSVALNESFARGVDFENNYEYDGFKTDTYYARCVRGGP